MRKILRRSLCCLLSIVLAMSSFAVAYAANEESGTTPVIVINDIDANPIYNTDDGTVIFNLSDYQYDLLFTSGFSSEITNLVSQETINDLVNGDISTDDMSSVLLDYFGFSADINKIVNSVLDFALGLMANMDMENIDMESILGSIDLNAYVAGVIDGIKADIEKLGYLAMNEDGTPAYDNIGIYVYNESLEYYYDEDDEFAYELAGEIGEGIAEEIGYENTYVFTYDWRIDPALNAEKLDAYIENVKAAAGVDKVSVISEGYGSVIATEYLAEYADNAADSVKNFVTVSSAFLGTSLMGDFFKGDIVNKFSDLNGFTSAYIRYANDISDNPITAFLMWILNYIMNTEWEAQSFCLDIEGVISSVYNLLVSNGVVQQMANMPGLWALVPSEDFDDAAHNMFGEDASGELYDTINAYRDNQNNYEDILVDAKDSGINVYVVASWDLQIIPIGENNSVQSDGIVDTANASFGATCVDINNVGEAMQAQQENADGHDHMSANYDMLTPWYSYGGACYYIDASTCALPENTWFIKNMKHGTFNQMSDSMAFLLWLVTSDTEKTVWQDVAYKQFMNYNRYFNPGLLLSDGFSAPGEVIPGKYLLGDVNLDGVITSIDSRLAARAADGVEDIEKGTVPFMNADVDGDGEITTTDAQMILDMSSALDPEHYIGVKVEIDDAESGMEKSKCSIELTPSYNPVTNQLNVTVTVLDAAGSYAGNFVIAYDEAMFTYSNAEINEVEGICISAGCPEDYNGVLTFAYSTSKTVKANQCDENGNLVLATFALDVTRKDIKATSLTAGSAYFYEDGSTTYIEAVTSELDEDFFFMLGDANNNRYISAADARYTLRVAAKLETIEDDLTFKRCDVDKDGKISASDARLILRAAANLIDSFDD